MKNFSRFVTVVASLLMHNLAHGEPLKVMTFNLYVGGDAGKQPLSQSVAVIQAANADVVGLQETVGLGDPRPDNAAKLAQSLGCSYLDQGSGNGVISKHRIIAATPRKSGVMLQTPGGNCYWLFNVHLAASPYQPYQLLNIPYHRTPFLKTEAEAINAASAARGGQVAQMLSELQPALSTGFPVFLTGDFNEPHYKDWTQAAVQAGLHPLKVEWPTTKTLAEAGMDDSFRAAHPDEVKRPGHTWTPRTKADNPKDHHDRIDFVFYGGKGVKLRGSSIIGEATTNADIVVAPYPSDHRAVVSTFEIGS